MNIEQVVAGMPKALFGKAAFSVLVPFSDVEMKKWDEATEAQCQLMAKQGYRKVPSMEELLKYLRQPLLHEQYKSWTSKSFAKELHRFFLEGE